MSATTNRRRRRRRRPNANNQLKKPTQFMDTLDQQIISPENTSSTTPNQSNMRKTRGEIIAERHRCEALERQVSIQQQISLLRWRKQQANAKIHNILSESRYMRQWDRDSSLLRQKQQNEHSQWMYSVVESEMHRPLEVDDDFIQKYTNDARSDYERLERNTRHHIDIVAKLKKQLLEKEDQRKRYVNYKIKREMYGLTPGPLDDGDGRAETPLDGGSSELDPMMTEETTPSKIVERLEDLDAIEHHLHSIRSQWARKEPNFLENPASDLFLLRVPQPLANVGGGNIAASSSMPQLGVESSLETWIAPNGASSTSLTMSKDKVVE